MSSKKSDADEDMEAKVNILPKRSPKFWKKIEKNFCHNLHCLGKKLLKFALSWVKSIKICTFLYKCLS